MSKIRVVKIIDDEELCLTFTVTEVGGKRNVAVDNFYYGSLHFVPLSTKDHALFHTHQALADLFNSTKNPNAKLYAGGGHEDKPDRNSAKIAIWGARDDAGDAMKCFIVYDTSGDPTPTPIAMINLGTSLISYNGKLIHEGGILFQECVNQKKHIDAINGFIKGYYHTMATTTPPLLDSSGWLYTVGPDNTSVVDALSGAEIGRPSDSVLGALLDWVNGKNEHRFTKDGTGAICESGIQKIVSFYDPFTADGEVVGIVDDAVIVGVVEARLDE